MRASVFVKIEPPASAQEILAGPVVSCVLPCLMAAHTLISNVHASARLVCDCLHVLDSVHLSSSLRPSRSRSMAAAIALATKRGSSRNLRRPLQAAGFGGTRELLGVPAGHHHGILKALRVAGVRMLGDHLGNLLIRKPLGTHGVTSPVGSHFGRLFPC